MNPIDEIKKLQKLYSEDKRQETFNLLLLGESGTGKTFLTRTCRFPVHIDSFDPGGTKGLRDLIAKGDVIVDTLYEGEDPKKPFAFKEWKTNFEGRVKDGYFNHFGTYVLDSSTSWSNAIMNWVLGAAGVAGEAPRFTKDYTPQKVQINNYLKKMLDLPCDFILTGHLKLVEDPEGGKYKFRYMTTGAGMVTIPLLFDEIWITSTKEKSDGTEYRILTQPTEHFLARSRLAGLGKLGKYEAANIKEILKKAGYPIVDLPKLSSLSNATIA